ncbi:MAG TPA: LamG domain-containing protein, partial [Phycisphaerae bacterium]|nr:LamG domain-containing protein [Phycisphaerae bacterium]
MKGKATVLLGVVAFLVSIIILMTLACADSADAAVSAIPDNRNNFTSNATPTFYFNVSGSLASGGTVTTSGGYTIHTFTSGGTFSVPVGSLDVQVLVVAGGGAGGSRSSIGDSANGGGGGGGIIYDNSYTASGDVSVTIGSGGSPVADTVGGNGGNSVFGSLTAIGGGGGGGFSGTKNGAAGGAGGGGSDGGTGGAGTANQGNAGGNAHTAGGMGSNLAGGGGGGGSGSYDGGNGGDGGVYTISGATVTYGGGGGGGTYSSRNAGNGGAGGGGAGGKGTDGASGTANTGGGGGGGGPSANLGGSGGSGIVIVSYLPTWTCELFINGTGYGTNTSVLNGTGAFIVANHSLTSDDYYNWYVNCTDIVGSRIESATNWLIYDTTKPNLALQTTTPNGTVTPNTSVSMNLTIGPENGPTYSFINWNNSLVGWWRFDNESPLIDWSSSGNAGTAKGNANQTVAGKFGEAYAFDGDGDYVDLGSDPQFDYENLTVCAWVKPASTASNQRIVAGGASNTNKWLLGRSGTGFVVANGSASGQNAWSVSAYASGEWYHVCMLRNPVKLYVNGIDDTGATSGTWSYGGSAKIGARDSSAGFFNGSIDEVIIFNRTLNSTEIGALYNSSQYALNASFSSLADANYTYRAYTVDSAGNVNSTGLFGMQVDTTTPFYNMVEAMPNTTADVDPGVLINVTVNVSTVRMSVSSVTLEYKSSVDLGYTNKTMYLDTDGLYRSNFTTDSSERTYIYRIWSNNSIGEANYSNTATLLSFWDHTWTIDRSDFGSVLGFIGNISVVGGILINNTGDDTMLFTMTALNYPLPVYFNGTANSKCFTLDGKNATGFDVTAQFSSITGTQTTLTINTTATYGAGVSSPPYNTTTATLITYTGGPYLDASISGYNATVVQGMTAYFNSTVTNLGNETANQTWINWSLASGMSNSSGLLELAAGSMSSGAGSHSNVTVYVDPASVSAGAASITLKANCTNCTEATASVSMAILCSGSSDGVCGSGCTYKSSATNYDPDCPAPSTTVVT